MHIHIHTRVCLCVSYYLLKKNARLIPNSFYLPWIEIREATESIMKRILIILYQRNGKFEHQLQTDNSCIPDTCSKNWLGRSSPTNCSLSNRIFSVLNKPPVQWSQSCSHIHKRKRSTADLSQHRNTFTFSPQREWMIMHSLRDSSFWFFDDFSDEVWPDLLPKYEWE